MTLLGPSPPLPGVRQWLTIRAEVARSQRRCEFLTHRIQAIDHALAAGTSTKAAAALIHPNSHDQDSRTLKEPLDNDLAERISFISRKQLDVTKKLAEARRVLVREAVAVFGVIQSPLTGWEIAGMPLPTPDAFRCRSSPRGMCTDCRVAVHRPIRINAALAHVVHLLSLISRYLGVGLPFYPSQGAPHLGRPRMKANIPLIGTTRFHDEPVLWMSSTTRAETADKPKSQAKHRRFLTAFALLAHSVAYLAHTQGTTGVAIPHDAQPASNDGGMIPVWSVLQLLESIANSQQLGTFSHEPGASRCTCHLLYGLDVAKVVGSVIRLEERRWGVHRLNESDLSEGWDLMESADEGGLG